MCVDTNVQILFDMLEGSLDENTVKGALKTFANSCGFDRFAYLHAEGLEIKTFNIYPERWQRTYLANNYSRIDPVMTKAKRCGEIFSWSADEWSSRGSSPLRRFRDEAIEHGLRCGVTIPIEASFGSTLLLTFASQEKRESCCAFDPRIAVQILMSVHYRLKMIAAATTVTPKQALAPREMGCVIWAAKGKNAWETAMLTGINPRTVQHYLDNARQKFDARTLPQLIAMVKDRGLF